MLLRPLHPQKAARVEANARTLTYQDVANGTQQMAIYCLDAGAATTRVCLAGEDAPRVRVPSARGDNEQTPRTPSSPSRGLAPDWAAADRQCIATIASATPPYLSYDGRDTTKPKLCRVDHGGPVDADKTTILMFVNTPQYLEQRGNWEAFLNKASYCRRTRRRFYIWIGVPPPSVLNARVDAPWARCRDKTRGLENTLNGVKNLAFLALFDDPSIDKVLYMDTDMWVSSEEIEPEAYFALTDADLLGNQNRVGGPKIPMNGGLVFARKSEFTAQFFALWWRGRCGDHDQLPLWATLFAAWSAATDGAYSFDDEHFKKYSHAHLEAVSLLQRDAMYIRQKANMEGPYDGGNFSATGLLDVPLALPHVLLLPSAPVGSLPAVRK